MTDLEELAALTRQLAADSLEVAKLLNQTLDAIREIAAAHDELADRVATLERGM